ncbi:hypothetical protein ACTFIV_006980 [Dictyostelium citrinum]
MTEVDQYINQIKNKFISNGPIQKTTYQFDDSSDIDTDDENNEKQKVGLPKINGLIETLKQNYYSDENKKKSNNLINNKRNFSCNEEDIRKKSKMEFYENNFFNGTDNFNSWLLHSIPYKCLECNSNHQPFKKQDFPIFSFFEPLTFIRDVNNVIHIELETPGVDKDDLKIDLSNNILTIIAKKKPIYPSFQNMCQFERHEKSIGVYKRVLEFNSNTVDKDTIKARYVNGILLITVDKFLL